MGGIAVPRTRVVHGRGQSNRPHPEPIIVSIGLEDMVVR